MTKLKENMKAIKSARVFMVISTIILMVGVSLGVSNNATVEAAEVNNATTVQETTTVEETTIEETTQEPVLSSVEAVEVATVTAVQQNVYSISANDYEALLKIVEAEAGGEDEIGKILVANVILNRAYGPKFADTVGEVIFSPGQFTPTQYSSFNNIQASESTRIAVDKALAGEDYSQGALYFCANSVSNAFSGYTQVLQHGGHTFFK